MKYQLLDTPATVKEEPYVEVFPRAESKSMEDMILWSEGGKGIDRNDIPKVPIKQNEVTTYKDFLDRSVVGDNLEEHEIWQHANLKANNLATNRLSTEASKNNPVIALDREQHKIINRAQRELDAANQLPIDNIMSNSKILRDNGIPEDIVDYITNKALKHMENTIKQE